MVLSIEQMAATVHLSRVRIVFASTSLFLKGQMICRFTYIPSEFLEPSVNLYLALTLILLLLVEVVSTVARPQILRLTVHS